MKKMKYLVIMVMVLSILTGCKGKEKEVNNNKQEEATKPIIAESFEFRTNSVNFENENSAFDITVKNTTGEEQYINEFLIHVKGESGEELAALFGYVNETIEGYGERVVTCSFGGNLSNYKTLDFEVLK